LLYDCEHWTFSNTFEAMSTQEQLKVEQQTVLQQERSLVLFNDHENSFDFVIDVLCAVCEHSEEQAEQCAWITHYKGKCQVLTGEIEELTHKATLMSDVGLTVEVQ
jgi:ATP-dependent Clp protease adaptor protein ClpS